MLPSLVVAAAPLFLAAKVREVVASQVDLDVVAGDLGALLGPADLEAKLFYLVSSFRFFFEGFRFFGKKEKVSKTRVFPLISRRILRSSLFFLSFLSLFSFPFPSFHPIFFSPVYSSKIRSSGTLSHEEEEVALPPQRRAARASSGEDDFFSPPLLPSPLAR